MQKVIAIIVISLCVTPKILAGSKPSWQSALPLSFATINDAAKPRLEFGSGFSISAWLWSFDAWHFGVGGGLFASMPFKTGNAAVRVNPYTGYVEPKLSVSCDLLGSFIDIRPFLSLRMHVGFALYSRRAHQSFSKNTDFLFACGPELGVAYWIDHWGFILSYSPFYGTKGFRQQFDISLALRSKHY